MPVAMGISIAKVEGVIAEQQTWERAEVARSASEALHTPDEQLIGDEANLARYLNPPMQTVYPKEYAFALLSIAFAALVACNLAFWRHLRRVYASPRRSVWRRG